MGHDYFLSYLPLLVFSAGALLFLLVGLWLNHLLSHKQPTDEKLRLYECGEEGSGVLPATFHVRYYVIALAFLLFEVEIIFLIPWAVSLTKTPFAASHAGASAGDIWSWFSFAEMSIFMAMIGLGWAFLWRRGHLQWVPKTTTSVRDSSSVLAARYAAVNKRYASSLPSSTHHGTK